MAAPALGESRKRVGSLAPGRRAWPWGRSRCCPVPTPCTEPDPWMRRRTGCQTAIRSPGGVPPPNEAHTRLHEREPVALWLGWICKLFVGHPGWLVRINNGWLGLLRTVYKPLYNVSNTSSWYLYATHCDYHLKELGMV